MQPIKRLLLAAGLLPLLHLPCAAAAPEDLPAPVVWDTAGAGAVDSMPIGNGEIALNVWSEPNGDVVFYIARTDAWDENGRLLKLGRIRLAASPALDVSGGNFRQTLNLRDGRISIHAGTGAQAADLDIAVDVNHPVVRIGMKSATPRKLKASLETWRKERRWVEEAGMTCWYMAGGYEALGMKVFSSGDVISKDSPDRLLWYHRNEESLWEFGLRHQGIFEAAKSLKDPLIRRTFGGIVAGSGFRPISPTELESDPGNSLDLLVCLHTAQTDTPEAWQAQAADALEQARKDAGWSAAHTRWWHDFWDRSYVRISKAPMQMAFAEQNVSPPAEEDFAGKLNQAYVLQRWISACAGRGRYPIKFNGSLFTIEPAPVNGTGLDPDFRQWGGEYWWQNTRLMYYPMLASGDFDMMKPMFAMYRAQLDLMKARTKTWYGVEGAAMCESGTFWGMWSNYDYGWKRPEGLPVGEMTSRFMWHYWFSGLELTWLMLEYYDHTNDRQFLEDTLLPMAEQFLLYFDQRFPRDADGRLRIYPSQALETWQDAENPVTDIAGLRACLERLTKLPQLAPGLRERWLKLQGEIPPIPLGEEAGRTVVLPAGKPLEPAKNIENPELYPVFPFRMFSLGKDQPPIGLDTYAARKNRGGWGWSQDGMQAAALGLREEAASILTRNLDRAHPKFRLPVFWGPNYDWLPDQCHGGNFLNTLQMMLLQSDGDRILVAPAWPKNWEGEFKLHAAHNTVVEGRIAGGRITRLEVTPKDRAKDIVPGLPIEIKK
jgi:hypothetical protein